ncbi:MAG: cache domain-containing protein, partial [Acidimicrobiales bacterium]
MSSASRQPEPRRPAPASPFGKRLLAATAAVSAAALLIGGAFAVRAFRGDQREVRVDLARAVRDAEAEADRFLQDRLAVLSGLAAAPAVVQGDRPAMQELFTAIVGDRVILDDIGWTPLDGRGAVLAGVPLADTAEVDLSQREYLQAVRATGRPYVSDGLVAQLRPAPVVVLAVPSADAAGAPTGVVTGVVRLDVLTPSGAALGGGRSVSIIDRAGRRIVAPAPIPELTPTPPELLTRLRAAGEDRAVAIDGVPSR